MLTIILADSSSATDDSLQTLELFNCVKGFEMLKDADHAMESASLPLNRLKQIGRVLLVLKVAILT